MCKRFQSRLNFQNFNLLSTFRYFKDVVTESTLTWGYYLKDYNGS